MREFGVMEVGCGVIGCASLFFRVVGDEWLADVALIPFFALTITNLINIMLTWRGLNEAQRRRVTDWLWMNLFFVAAGILAGAAQLVRRLITL